MFLNWRPTRKQTALYNEFLNYTRITWLAIFICIQLLGKQILHFTLSSLLPMSNMVATSNHFILNSNDSLKSFKFSSSVTLPTYQVLSMSSDYHTGYCKYRLYPPVKKVLSYRLNLETSLSSAQTYFIHPASNKWSLPIRVFYCFVSADLMSSIRLEEPQLNKNTCHLMECLLCAKQYIKCLKNSSHVMLILTI